MVADVTAGTLFCLSVNLSYYRLCLLPRFTIRLFFDRAPRVILYIQLDYLPLGFFFQRVLIRFVKESPLRTSTGTSAREGRLRFRLHLQHIDAPPHSARYFLRYILRSR